MCDILVLRSDNANEFNSDEVQRLIGKRESSVTFQALDSNFEIEKLKSAQRMYGQ
jgi:hypothetical protein